VLIERHHKRSCRGVEDSRMKILSRAAPSEAVAMTRLARPDAVDRGKFDRRHIEGIDMVERYFETSVIIGDSMTDRVPAIRVLLLPKDTNAYGTIFGGVILSHIDLASAIEARKLAPHHYVTKAFREVEFHEPVHLGDIVSFYTETVRVGRTSVTVRVVVEAEHWGEVPDFGRDGAPGQPRRAAEAAKAGTTVKVTEAEVVLVAVDADGRPVPVRPDSAQA
jgi:acyl-CoA thioesterase YciA